MAYTITLAGQDITTKCEQMSIEIDDTLGQGAGAGGSTQGRATTFKVLSSLGPANTAIGNGTTPTGSLKLVRQGEVVVVDQNGNTVFGGFVTKYTDQTEYVVNYTLIEAIDYSTSLQRIMVNKTYSAVTDIQMITDLITTYAPWVSLSLLPTSPAYTFPTKKFRNITLEQALQFIAQITGFQMWVDYIKRLNYVPPTLANSAPFNLSDSPDFLHAFPHYIDELVIDDNSAINKVTFFGGKTPSNDFTQDLSPMCNGNNVIFTLANFPQGIAEDDKIHVTVNGVEQVVGHVPATDGDVKNTYKSQGGLCDVLINRDARNVQFDMAPSTGAVVLCKYRFEFPLQTIVTDETSHKFFGDPYLEAVISDETIFDTATAVQRCRVLLIQQSFGLISLKVRCWRPGIFSGQTIRLTNVNRGIDQVYIVQEVMTKPQGGGNFEYTLTLGAWNWNLVDIVLKLAQKSTGNDLSTDETTTLISLLQTNNRSDSSTTAAAIAHTSGGYRVRDTALGDGHDSFVGICTTT